MGAWSTAGRSLEGHVLSLSAVSDSSVLGTYLLSDQSIKLIPDSPENYEGSL